MFTWNGFTDVTVQYDPEFTISYRTANFVFEEGLREGRWVALAYNASGYLMGTNPLPKPFYMDVEALPRPQSFEVTLDGQSLISHFVFENHEITKEGDTIQVRVTLKHTLRPVKIHVCTKLDGTPVMERRLEIENLKDGPAALSEIAPLSGGLQVLREPIDRTSLGINYHDPIFRLGYMEDSAWGREGNFVWTDLISNAVFTIGGRYRWDRHRHPLFVLNNTVTGEYFIAQFAWSGGYTFSFDFQDDPVRFLNDPARPPSLCVSIAMDDPAPLCVLMGGEIWVSPSVHIGAVFGGLDEAVNSMHGHVRKFFYSQQPQKSDPRKLIRCGIGPEYVMSEKNTLAAMEYAASCGAEIFWIDAGWFVKPGCEGDWFATVGDWQVNEERYPRGIGPLRDRCHELGMRFGLWMEPERAGKKSVVREQHPQWIQKDYYGKPNRGGQLDLGIPECAAWVEDQIASVIVNNQLEFFRLDWNTLALQTIGARETEGWLENSRVRYYEAVYGIFQRLRTRFPNVIFENCASGGARTDIGMVRYFDNTWVSDWGVHPNAFRVVNGMTMALPPEYMVGFIGGMLSYSAADTRFHMRNLLFTTFVLGFTTPPAVEVNEKQIEIIKHYVKIYKEFVRPFNGDSRIYHHTPELPRKDPGYGVLELDSADGTRGMLGIFRLSTSQEGELVIKLRGIDMSKNFRVTFDNSGTVCVVSGYELAQKGVYANLEGALTSELVLYEAT
jgi:alpha-galactosidase